MLKGIGKQVVVIKNPNSKLFEEAIFIIKDGAYSESHDLLTECERIIRLGDNYNEIAQKRKRNKRLILSSCIVSWTLGAIAVLILTLQIL